jgi:hypothetical protein
MQHKFAVHHKNDRPRTLGFPALQSGNDKTVRFDPPRSAICISLDGRLCTECLVISVWDRGARLNLEDVQALTEFVLLFATAPRPVMRQCKRVAVCGKLIDVEYVRDVPSYARHMEYAHDIERPAAAALRSLPTDTPEWREAIGEIRTLL